MRRRQRKKEREPPKRLVPPGSGLEWLSESSPVFPSCPIALARRKTGYRDLLIGPRFNDGEPDQDFHNPRFGIAVGPDTPSSTSRASARELRKQSAVREAKVMKRY